MVIAKDDGRPPRADYATVMVDLQLAETSAPNAPLVVTGGIMGWGVKPYSFILYSPNQYRFNHRFVTFTSKSSTRKMKG